MTYVCTCQPKRRGFHSQLLLCLFFMFCDECATTFFHVSCTMHFAQREKRVERERRTGRVRIWRQEYSDGLEYESISQLSPSSPSFDATLRHSNATPRPDVSHHSVLRFHILRHFVPLPLCRSAPGYCIPRRSPCHTITFHVTLPHRMTCYASQSYNLEQKKRPFFLDANLIAFSLGKTKN